MDHLNPKNPGVSSPSKMEGRTNVSLSARERGETKGWGQTARSSRRLRAGRWPGSRVKTVGREEVSSHMHGESWILDGSEVKSRRHKAKEQRKGAASFRH